MSTSVPPIVVGRFGLEQRCSYRHPDLYDEEVPEIDLDTALAQPLVGGSCAVLTFLLLGDQNAGKSTMLHSFCRAGDEGFIQLSSLLPILSSSFLNSRLIPRSQLGAQGDVDEPLSIVRDEMPFMDTDIGRGLVLVSLENFMFFCNEFGISGYLPHGVEALPGQQQGDCHTFGVDTDFVALQFIELGGDHLDRLVEFTTSGRDLENLRAAGMRDNEPGCDEESQDAFWKDIHETLLGSMKLLASTTRTVYFINCSTLLLGGSLCPAALQPMLRKLLFLDSALCGGAGGSAEIIFYCSRVPEAAAGAADLDVRHARRVAEAEVQRFASERLASGGACGTAGLEASAHGGWVVDDEGLDLSPLEEVSKEDAVRSRAAEQRAAGVLAFVHELLVSVVFPSLQLKLRLCGVYAVRNLADNCLPAPGGGSVGTLCVPSIVRNVARLLQRRLCAAPEGSSLTSHIAELIIRCAVGLRGVQAPELPGHGATITGRWVQRSDLAAYLEECEAESAAVPLPELATLQGWAAAVAALTQSAVCVQLASASSGLPRIRLQLAARSEDSDMQATVQLRAASAAGDTASGDGPLFFVMRPHAAKAAAGPEGAAASRCPGVDGVGLPLDAELFRLLGSESAIRSICAHAAAGGKSPGPFRFLAPEAAAQLRSIYVRLRSELDAAVERVVAWAAAPPAGPAMSGTQLPPGALSRLLHFAGDVWQARVLLEHSNAEPSNTQEPSAKRACSQAAVVGPVALEFLVGKLTECASGRGTEPGVDVALNQEHVVEDEACEPVLRVQLSHSALAALSQRARAVAA